MLPLNAIFLAPAVNTWLAHSRGSRILHVFDQACNLINEQGEFLSIVTPQIGNGPFNLVIEDDLVFMNYLDVESPVFARDEQLHLGELTIHMADAKLWSARPNWESLHSNKEGVLGQLASLGFADYQPLLPQHLISNLSIAFANADIPIAVSMTRQLAGLGQGLTPAGDDFIMGAVYAVRIIYPPEVANILALEITNIAAPLTTSLSAAWLRSAGRGEAGILWHNFFDLLSMNDSSIVKFQITELLSIGHTSGADALAGFFGTLFSLNSLVSPNPEEKQIYSVQR